MIDHFASCDDILNEGSCHRTTQCHMCPDRKKRISLGSSSDKSKTTQLIVMLKIYSCKEAWGGWVPITLRKTDRIKR